MPCSTASDCSARPSSWSIPGTPCAASRAITEKCGCCERRAALCRSAAGHLRDFVREVGAPRRLDAFAALVADEADEVERPARRFGDLGAQLLDRLVRLDDAR